MRRPHDRRESYYVNNQQDNTSFNWLDRGVLIGVLTALGYFVAYSYQKGFLSYFGVTDLFLSQITIVSIILSTSVVGTGLFMAFGAYNHVQHLIFKELPESYNPIWIIFKRSLLYLFVVLVLLISFIDSWRSLLIILSGLIIYWYIWPVLNFWKVKGYKNKLKSQLEYKEKSGFTKNDIIFAWKNYPSFKIIVIVIAFMLLPSIAEVFGVKKAKETEEFYIYQNNQSEDYVVIDNVGSKFITAPIDLSTNEIEKKYLVVEQKSGLKNPLIFEKVKIEGGISVKRED